MAVTNATTTVTTMDKLIGESWSPETNDAVEDAMVWPKTFNDISDWLKTGDTVRIPYMYHLTPQVKSAGLANTVNWETFTPAEQVVQTFTHHYAAFNIEIAMEEFQSYPVRSKLTEQISYALDLGVEQASAAIPSGWTGNSPVGTLAVDLNDDDILQMREYLVLANALEGDRFLMVTPQAYTGIMKVDKFINMDYNGDRTGRAVREAYVGHIYGLDVLVSNQCKVNGTGHDMSAHQRKAVYIIRKGVTNHVHWDDDNFATSVAGRHQFKVVTANRIPEGGTTADTPGSYTADDKFGVWVKGL